MREFFKPWRQKLGCVTLLMACVVMAGWVRSSSYCDFVSLLRTDKQLLREFGSSRMGLSYTAYFQDFSQSPLTSVSFATQAKIIMRRGAVDSRKAVPGPNSSR